MKKLIQITLILLVLAGAAVAVTAFLSPKEYASIEISNPESVSELSTSETNLFRTYLSRHLKDQNLLQDNTSLNDAVIRADTVTSTTSIDYSPISGRNETVTVTTFLVDIDSIKQTYRIKIVESTGEITDVPVHIECPRVSETKYPNSACVGQYGDTNLSVINQLPYEFNLKSGEEVLVKSISTPNILQVYLYSCDSSNPPVRATTSAVQDWLDSLGNEEDYEINVRTGYCEGDTI